MNEDTNLALDEERRLEQHEAVKNAVGASVNADIARAADESTPRQQAQAEALGRDFHERAVNEVVETDNEVARAKGVARVSQVIDYMFYVIYGIVSLEIILELLGAHDTAGFKRFVDTLAAPFVGPFRGLMTDPSAGPFHLMLSYVMALVAYLLLHLAVNGLLRLFAHRKVVV